MGEHRSVKDRLRNICVLLAPVRAHRPHDPPGGPVRCPFCPGNEDMTPPEIDRVGEGQWQVRVFPNKYPATDLHEIVVDSPEHGIGLEDLSPEQLAAATGMWAKRARNMYQAGAAYVSLFHNRGKAAGASRQHIHTQIIGLKTLPPRIKHEIEFLRANPDYMQQTISRAFVLYQNQTVVGFCPPVSVWPYEIWIAPKRKQCLLPTDTGDFADVLGFALRAMASALGRPDYNVLVKTMPDKAWWWRVEIIPRTGKLAGFELDTGCRIVSVPPERAREELLKAMDQQQH